MSYNFKDVNFSIHNQRFRYVGAGREGNVIADHPEVATSMKAAYDPYRKEARPLMVNENAPMSPSRPYHEGYREQKAAGGIPKWVAPEL